MTEKICILGVGRSGTTALYSTLQKILSRQHGEKVDFIYEPFLWDRNVFNRHYTDLRGEFSKVSSLSIDGTYWNKNTPLFLTEDTISSFEQNDFYKALFIPKENKPALLAKYIRANGRFPLLRKISPDTKFIFLLRNPLDVINSSIGMFSFFGDDFYASDFPRFATEVKEIWGDTLPEDTIKELRECFYWYYMNKAFIREFKRNPNNVLIVVYENYVKDKLSEINRICDFLGVSHEHVPEEYSQQVGPSYSSPHLTKDGYESILPYLDSYSEFVRQLGETVDLEPIRTKYKSVRFIPHEKTNYDGRTTLYLRKRIRKLEAENSILRKRTIWSYIFKN